MTNAANPLQKPSKPKSLTEFALFLLLGGVAALTNLVVRYLLNLIMPFEVAVVLAYIAGMVVAFLLFGRVIFDGKEHALSRRIIRFTQVNVLGAGLAWSISVAMARFVLPAIGWGWHPLEIAHFVGVAAPAFTSYFLHKHYTFA